MIFTACLSISISAVYAQTAEDNSNDALLSENQMKQEVSSDFVVNSDNDDNLTLENCSENYITLNFGNSRSVVVIRNNIYNVIRKDFI